MGFHSKEDEEGKPAIRQLLFVRDELLGFTQSLAFSGEIRPRKPYFCM